MKKRKILQGVIAVCLLVPAVLTGFFLPRVAAIWQDRQLESDGSIYETDQVNLQLIPELTISEKLRLVGSDYSAIYNGISGSRSEQSVLSSAEYFWMQLTAYGFDTYIVDVQEYTATPFLAIQADDSSRTAILWRVNFYFTNGYAVRLVMDDETGLVLAATIDLTEYYQAQFGEDLDKAGTFVQDVLYNMTVIFGEIMMDHLGFTGYSTGDFEQARSGACDLYLYGASDVDDVHLTVRLHGTAVSCNE